MIDKLDALEMLLPSLPTAAERRRLGDRLTKTVNDLKDADHALTRLQALIATAELVGLGRRPEQAASLQELQEDAFDLGVALAAAQDEAALQTASVNWIALVKAMGPVETAVRSQWRVEIESRFQPMVSFGQLLGSLDGVADLGRRLADCGRNAQAAATLSPAVDLLARVQSLYAEFESLQAERAEKIGAGEVGDFLNALAERRATLGAVTKKVRDFLEENHALERFAVSPI